MYSCVQNNSIFNWLNGFSLGHYTELFNRYGYDSIDKLYQINHAILAEMGITSLLDRNRIIDNIQLLKKNSTATSINKIPSGKKTLKPSFNTTPNVTFYNNQMYPSDVAREFCTTQTIQNTNENRHSAQQVANNILEYAKAEDQQSKYTCKPINSLNISSQLRKESPLESLKKLVDVSASQVGDLRSVLYDNTTPAYFEIQKPSQKRPIKSLNGKNRKKLKSLKNEEAPLTSDQNNFCYYQNNAYDQNYNSYSQPYQQNISLIDETNQHNNFQEQYYEYF